MLEGQYLGHPPIDIRAVGSRRLQHSLMAAMNLYAGGAGGFHQVPAMPASLQALRAPSTVNRPDSIKMVELYAGHPGLFKQRLASQFREPRARVTSGRLAPLIPQLEDT